MAKVDWKTVAPVLGAVLVSAVAMGISTYSWMAVQDVKQDYEDSLTTIRFYPIITRLEVEELNGTIHYVALSQIGEPDQEVEENGIVIKTTYCFDNPQIGLEATFRYVHINVFVPEMAYNAYDIVSAFWRIEDKEAGVDDFGVSDRLPGFVESSTDVTKYLWKLDVPDEVIVVVTLQNN